MSQTDAHLNTIICTAGVDKPIYRHVFLLIHRQACNVHKPANVSLKPVEVVSRARRGTDAQFS